ncbi:unnamed protein product [Psylliodes chrysocephalus]|uniref:Uncharacterized protein n=1 Tax=Psylliodes chrysocephalus TaxID=3402493 RepID=A0A9P0GFE1_9CUCU|nr:unnamed protein product [Psylliodes chrysocephala]
MASRCKRMVAIYAADNMEIQYEIDPIHSAEDDETIITTFSDDSVANLDFVMEVEKTRISIDESFESFNSDLLEEGQTEESQSAAPEFHVDFLQKKFKRTMQEPEAIPVRGIPKQKKDAIIAVLGQLMSKNRLEFWNSIKENDSAQDLVDSQGTENID